MSHTQNTIIDEMNKEYNEEDHWDELREIARDEKEQMQRMDAEDQLKECQTCGTLKESYPTPDGDEVCPSCGDREMLDYEQEEPFKMMEKVHEFLYNQGKSLTNK